jgi:hypothetical protein
MTEHTALDRDKIVTFIDKLNEETQNLTSKHKHQARKIAAAAHLVSQSWSESCFGPHALLYFRDFEKPNYHNRFNVEWGLLEGMPPGWAERTVDEVKSRINALSGVDAEEVDEALQQFAERASQIKEDLLLELVPVSRISGTERALFTEIESIQWNRKEQNEHVAGIINACSNMTRDFASISAPRRYPIHPYYEALEIQLDAYVKKVSEVVRTTRRLLKHLDLGAEPVSKGQADKAASEVRQVFNLHGTNARINIHSVDGSNNISVHEQQVFADLRKVIAQAVQEKSERDRLLKEVEELNKAHRSGAFFDGYLRFVSAIADHMTLFAPFIPALTKLLGS